jgi:hypothetical protein
MPARMKGGEFLGDDELVFYDGSPEIVVANWCPTPEPTVPPTQVHLIVPGADGARLCIRFKTAAAIDRLIATLAEHRADVWGPRSS